LGTSLVDELLGESSFRLDLILTQFYHTAYYTKLKEKKVVRVYRRNYQLGELLQKKSMKDCVYLIGCRAVGKSSIGMELAKRLGYEFLDTDTLIVGKKKASVATIVAEEGWQGFRKVENEVLSELRDRNHCVVATGGGAILHRDIWLELKKQGQVIWLTADLEILCERLRLDLYSETLRPSLTGKDICQELGDILIERKPLYRETADIVVDTGKMTVTEAVHFIEQQVVGS